MSAAGPLLVLEEGEEDRRDDEAEGDEMIPMESLALEEQAHEDGEHAERDDLLYHLQLHEVEGAARYLRADAVGRYHEGVFEQRQSPRQHDDADERPVLDEIHLLQLEVAIPGKRHEDVGEYEHEYG